jgi:hypothetical protein
MSKKKIAICISGIPKFWQHSIKSIQKYFPDADIFVHMWHLDENTITSIKTNGGGFTAINHGDYNKQTSYKSYTQLNEETLVKTFAPKKYTIENLNDYKSKFEVIRQKLISESWSLSHAAKNVGMVSMFYGIEQVTLLKNQYELENKIKYDIIVRMRFDSNIHDIQNLSDNSIRPKSLFTNNIKIYNKYWWLEFDNDTLVIPEGNDYGGICDQFWFASSELFDQVSKAYSNLENIIKSCKRYHPETVFKFHLKNIKIKRIPIFVGINNV